jgi:hypothetical protein
MSKERTIIDAVKRQVEHDSDGSAHAYMHLFDQAQQDTNCLSPQLKLDSVGLALFDIAYGELKVGRDAQGALIMCQDAQRRIDTAKQLGVDVHNLQHEEDRLKARLPQPKNASNYLSAW